MESLSFILIFLSIHVCNDLLILIIFPFSLSLSFSFSVDAGESSSLLGHTSLLHMHGDQSQSDLSVKLCEIDDSETDELNGSNNYLKSMNTNWTKTSTHTDV
jgi:hypothetical protein